MIPNFKEPLRANVCYKVNRTADDLDREAVGMSLRFFANKQLRHVVLEHTPDLAPVVNSWRSHIGELPKKAFPVDQIRVVIWAARVWIIMSMEERDVYGLVLYTEEWGYELRREIPIRRDGVTTNIRFPFWGQNFFTLVPTAS